MKKLFLLTIVSFTMFAANAQIKNPVKWNYASKKLNATSYEVHLTAAVDPGWHIYSQTTPDGGPVPTKISFFKNPLLTISGDAREVGKLEQRHEDLFGVDVKQFSSKVDFVQTVQLKGKARTALNGTIEFMTCNDKECLPPRTENFSIPLK